MWPDLANSEFQALLCIAEPLMLVSEKERESKAIQVICRTTYFEDLPTRQVSGFLCVQKQLSNTTTIYLK
jgi:hypothetical protein